MPTIHLTTFIEAPLDRVFDVSRSITIYKKVFNDRQETFSTGAGGNLLQLGETITIQAKHLGKIRTAVLKLTNCEETSSFMIEQTSGTLMRFKHEHYFKSADNGTILIDILEYENLKDMVGKWLLPFHLKKYLQSYVELRNQLIKEYAETDKWNMLLN